MTYALGQTKYRRPDKHVMFVVSFQDGSRGFVRIPPELAQFGAGSSAMLEYAAEQQRQGRLQPGKIAKLIRVH